MFSQARGKVLFIDEAYQLNPKQGGGALLVDEQAGQGIHERVVILAGYEQDNFSAEILSKLPTSLISSEDMTLSTEAT